MDIISFFSTISHFFQFCTTKLFGELLRVRNVLSAFDEFQERYYGMKGNDWRHLIRDYVYKVTERPELQENEVFRYVMAG